MNPHAERRLQIARDKIAPIYAAHPDVAAVVVCGSASRDLSDSFSDLEMCTFWTRPPTDEERLDLIRQTGGTRVNLYPFEEENGDWSEEFLLPGLKVDMGHRTLDFTEHWIADTIERFNPDLSRQDTISLIHDAIPLHGAPVIDHLRALSSTYPDELARAVVLDNFDFPPAWEPVMLAERGDLLPLYTMFTRIERRIIMVLLGLNHLYLHHQGFKWVDWLTQKLTIAPPNLSTRLSHLFMTDPLTAAYTLNDLIQETVAFVETHMPDLDISEEIAHLNRQRNQ
jgi:hypothetical protein